MTRPDRSATGLRPRQECLELVVEVWSNRRDGSFDGPGLDAQGRTVVVVAGEPPDRDALTALRNAWCQRGLRFREHAPPRGSFGRAPMGPALLDAARILADPDRFQRALTHPLAQGPHAKALSRLPLRPTTRRVVRAALHGSRKLGDVISASRVAPEDVGADLSALAILGMVRSPGLAAPRFTGNRAVAAAADMAVRRNELARRRMENRLERDWRTLQHADDWAVLGVQRGAAPGLLQRAAARMRERYTALEGDVESPEALRTLQLLQRRVESAIDALGAHHAEVSTGSELVPGPTQALGLGQEAAARGDFSRARRWFGSAHRHDPHDPIVLAWYGWAMIRDPRTRAGRALDRGRRFLRTALELAGDDPGIIERALDAALHMEDPHEGAQLLERLKRLDPDNPRLVAYTRRLGRLG